MILGSWQKLGTARKYPDFFLIASGRAHLLYLRQSLAPEGNPSATTVQKTHGRSDAMLSRSCGAEIGTLLPSQGDLLSTTA